MRLTELSHGAGCACKLDPAVLETLRAGLPAFEDAALLVGAETADDAAVYRVSDDVALISTLDFFTPIVDDPYDFGRIAATNALSDVYAMGGWPVSALNIVAWSTEKLGEAPLREILRGGADAAAGAGVAIAGGHSIDDREPKYGLAVTGVVHPDRIVRNSTARAGDDLYLSKPLGGGIVSTAAKRGVAGAALIGRMVDVMTTLNREACRLALAAGASAMTDVTGFGLLGHLHEMCAASGVSAEVHTAAIPAVEGVAELLAADEPPIAGGTRRNRAWVEPWVSWGTAVPEPLRWLACDAMTSGGLLVAASAGHDELGARVGRIVDDRRPGSIEAR